MSFITAGTYSFNDVSGIYADDETIYLVMNGVTCYSLKTKQFINVQDVYNQLVGAGAAHLCYVNGALKLLLV